MPTSATARDELSGESFSVSVKKFVNATGTGADKIRRLANPMLAARMRPSKGVHLLFSAETFAGTDALVVPHTEDGRVIFAVPCQGRFLVGTTYEQLTPATTTLTPKHEPPSWRR